MRTINKLPDDLQKIINNNPDLLKKIEKMEMPHCNTFANNIPKPNYDDIILRKKEPEPKKGAEAWVEKHQGKIAIAGVLLAFIAVVEAFIIFMLSN